MMHRRHFLKAAGVVSLGSLVGLGGLELAARAGLDRARHGSLVAAARKLKEMHIGFTDGFASMPAAAARVAPFYPDPAAPSPFTTYVFGVRDLTGMSAGIRAGQKGLAAISAPLLYCDQGDDFRVHLHNLGLANRPDLIDSHTMHWHGFPNQIVYFDGVPDNSLAVPIGREMIYRYLPQDPGTYMYHCHVEDVEHVHLGLTGVVFVRPAINGDSQANPAAKKCAYNDLATAYDREYAFLVSELDNHAHFNDRHQQDTDWSDYKPAFRLLNGRAWPDTAEPNIDSLDRNLAPRLQRLRFQPNSSLLQANEGEKVLIRIANLGFEEHSMVLPGLPLTVVGRDAKPLAAGRPDYGVDPPAAGGRGDITSTTYRLDLGPGESRDVIFTAPKLPSGSKQQVYSFYDRNYGFVRKQDGQGGDGFGGIRTEVRVYPAGTLDAQPRPHAVFDFSNYPSSTAGRWTWAAGTS
jgi:FtsP/CotA-like multicopper oxidase with cupredoxin domain